MKTIATLGLAGLSVSRKIEKSRFIVVSITGNANFPTPNPTLATITANINALETAHIAALGGGADDTANKHVKETLLELSLKQLAAYVESIANATPLTAEAIVLSAGLGVKGKGGMVAREFEVRPTANPGEVKISHKAVKRGSYEYQIATDVSSESNWKNFYSGTRGRIVKNGLVSGTRYYFRSAVIDKNGHSPWSEVKSTIVL